MLPEQFNKRMALVVDDERFSLEILERQLKELGFGSVYTAVDGKNATELLTDQTLPPFDCVIADFNMPKMNGLELLKFIRTGRQGVRRDTPVLMLTGVSDQKLVGSAIALDVDAFILKPTPIDALEERITRAFSLRPRPKSRAEYGSVDIKIPPPTKTDTAPPPKPKPVEPDKALAILEMLKPGDILAGDIKTSSGIVILPKGVKLTKRLIAGLRDLASLADSINEIKVNKS